MYCKYCGAELREDAKFCTKCGKCMSVSSSVVKNPNKTEESKNKPSKLLKMMLPIIVVLLVAIIFIIVKSKMGNNITNSNETGNKTSSSNIDENETNIDLLNEENIDKSSGTSINEPEREDATYSENIESDVTEKVEDGTQNENSLQLSMLIKYVEANRIYELVFMFNNNGKEIEIRDVLDRGRTFVDDREVSGNETYTLPVLFKEFYDNNISSEQSEIDELYLDACEYYSQTGVCDYEKAIDFFPSEFTFNCAGKEFAFHTTDAVIRSTNISHLNKNAKAEPKVPFYYRDKANNDREIICDMTVVANVESEDMDAFTDYVTSVVEWYVKDRPADANVDDKDATEDEIIDVKADATNAFNGMWSQKGDDSYVFTLEDGIGHLHSDFSDDCDVTYTYNGKVLYMETNFGTVEYYYYPDKDLLCRDTDGAEFYRQ